MDISWTTVIIVILLIVIVYFIWGMISSSEEKVSTGTTKITTSTSLAIASPTNSFTFSTWIAINSWTITGGNLITTPTDTAASVFALKLGTTINQINLSIGTVTTTFTTVGLLPLQTWASIIVSVNSGNSADVYINGKLVRTIALTATYTLPAGTITVGGTTGAVDGYISTKFDNKSIGPQDAWNIYSSGYGGDGGSGVGDFFNKYKIRFAFVKDNVELSRFEI